MWRMSYRLTIYAFNVESLLTCSFFSLSLSLMKLRQNAACHISKKSEGCVKCTNTKWILTLNDLQHFCASFWTCMGCGRLHVRVHVLKSPLQTTVVPKYTFCMKCSTRSQCRKRLRVAFDDGALCTNTLPKHNTAWKRKWISSHKGKKWRNRRFSS